MYGKLFASLYHGTLRGHAHEILVFSNMIAHADKDGYVDKHWRAIAEECGLSVEQVKAACEKLEAPDPESRSAEADGARIIRIDNHRAWGWKITNYAKYRAIRSEEDRRIQNREAKRREREKVSNVSHCQPMSAVVSHGQPSSAHAEAEAEEEEKSQSQSHDTDAPVSLKSVFPTLQEVLAWADMNAVPKECAEKWWFEHDARGGCDRNLNSLTNWASALRGYAVGWRARSFATSAQGTKKLKGDMPLL